MDNNADVILDQWIGTLIGKRRDWNNVESNFDELFESLKSANVTFEVAHSLLTKATKAHFPNPIIATRTYNHLKTSGMVDMNKKDYIEHWQKSIEDVTKNSFYTWYPIKTDDDNEPKVYGNMSKKEYRLQRSHADSIPTLKTDELKARWLKKDYELDIQDLLKTMLEEKK